MQIEISQQEAAVILAALRAVSPTGGGSTPFTVFRAVQERTGQEVDYSLTNTFQQFAHAEYREFLEDVAGDFPISNEPAPVYINGPD